MSDNYSAAASLTTYYPNRTTNQPARLWSIEKALHDLAAIGAVEFFEGDGDDPTGLDGYSTDKLWLRVSSGITTSTGTVRKYIGGTESLLASWAPLDRTGFAAHIGSISAVSSAEDATEVRSYAPGSFESVHLRGPADTIGAGAGMLYWDSASTATDDGVRIFKPTVLGPASPGRYIRENNGEHLVTWWAVDRSGATDSTTAIQSAITAIEEYRAASPTLGAGAGGSLIMPYGLYTCSEPLKIKGSGVVIDGQSPGAAVVRMSASFAGAALFLIEPASPLVDQRASNKIRNLGLRDLRTNPTSGDIVRFSRQQDWSIDNCLILGGYRQVALLGCTHGSATRLMMQPGATVSARQGRSTGLFIGRAQVDAGDATAVVDPVDGLSYTECNNVYISSCTINATNGRWYSAVDIRSGDGIQIADSHFGFGEEAVVLLEQEQANMGLGQLMASNVYVDGAPSTASFAGSRKGIYYKAAGLGAATRVHSHAWSNIMADGQEDDICITEAVERIKFSKVTSKAGNGAGISLHAGKNIVLHAIEGYNHRAPSTISQTLDVLNEATAHITMVGIDEARQFYVTATGTAFVGTMVLEYSTDVTPATWTTYASYVDGAATFARTMVDDTQDNVRRHYRLRLSAYTSGSVAVVLEDQGRSHIEISGTAADVTVTDFHLSGTGRYGIHVFGNADRVVLGNGVAREQTGDAVVFASSSRAHRVSGEIITDRSRVLASAGTLRVPVEYRVLQISGTTTITNIDNAAAGGLAMLDGRDVTLVFGAANCVVSNTGNIVLNNGPFVSAVNSTLRLVFIGNFAYEVSRSSQVIRPPYVLANSAAPVSLTGTTTETPMATIAIPAGALGAKGMIRATVLWSYPNSANSKTCQIRFGATGSGITGTVYASTGPTTTVCTRLQQEIQNRNNVASQVGNRVQTQGGWGTSASAPPTSTVNTANASELVITGMLASAAETLVLESYLVEICYGA